MNHPLLHHGTRHSFLVPSAPFAVLFFYGGRDKKSSCHDPVSPLLRFSFERPIPYVIPL